MPKMGEDHHFAIRLRENKQHALDLVAKGVDLKAAIRATGRTESVMKRWLADPQFARDLEDARDIARIEAEALAGKGGKYAIDFATFSKEFLGMQVFPHQQNWIDVLEGREPSWKHPSMIYSAGNPKRLLINVPPEHCAVTSTPVLSANRGWITVGDVEVGDELFDHEGYPTRVFETWQPSDDKVDVFRVTFDTGDAITTDANHQWVIDSPIDGVQRLVTTKWLMEHPRHHHANWRTNVQPGLVTEATDLPLDPYLLGYWLGDGDAAGYRLAVGEEDLESLRERITAAGFEFKTTQQRGGYSVYVYGMTKHLRSLGVLGAKRIPELYSLSSDEQRRELLRGLMDSDGTITVKDSRGRWVQHDRDDLALDVYRLVASLGLKPHWKQYAPSQSYHTDARVSNEVSFRTGNWPVFALKRKADRQRPLPESKGKSTHRTIRSVEPAGTDSVKCISVLSDGNLFLIGDAMIPTHNAKSTTITVNYATYLICMNPNIKIAIVSKTQTRAAEFLYAIKQRLTEDRWVKLQQAYQPDGGFRETSDQWTQTRIYLKRDSDAKDPTVQALGIGQQIYGTRADIIFVDDAVDTTNAHEYEKHMTWLQKMAITRVGKTGRIVIVGTRVDAIDFYKEIRNEDRWSNGQSPFTHFAMPAVLEFANSPKDWVTLWPRSDRPWEGEEDEVEPDEDGLFQKWDGPALYTRRGEVSASTWALVYQQQDIEDDAIFNRLLVSGATNSSRRPGPLRIGNVGHPTGGSWVTLIGMDPAMTGKAGFVAYAVERGSGKRLVLDAVNMVDPSPQKIRAQIEEWVHSFQPMEVIIEINAHQKSYALDTELVQWLANYGVKLRPHFTGKNKWDSNYGVGSMAALLGSERNGKAAGDNLLELPSNQNEGVKALTQQMLTWKPDTKNPTDVLMALWFCEMRAKELVTMNKNRQTHVANRWATRKNVSEQYAVSLNDYATVNYYAN